MSRATAHCVGAGALTLAAAGVLCLATGVSVGDLAAFSAYQGLVVLLPGVAVYRALARGPGGLLRHISIGGAVGYSLELIAFMATAAAGMRGAFLAYPVIVLAIAGPVAWRRRVGQKAALLSPRQAWALAAVAVTVLGLWGASALSQAPLPGREASVSYYPDLIWGISIAAEAKHHWPLTTPQVAGEPLRYHTFVFMHMAATSDATGIDLPVLALRLAPLALLLLLIAQLAHAGRHLTGRAWAAPLAAGAVLLVGDLDLGEGRPEPFVSLFFSGLFLSPTQLLGLVAFVPAVVVIRDLLEDEAAAVRPGDLALLALLLFLGAGAKGSVLPVLLGGLVLFTLWRLWRRAPVRAAVTALAVMVVALAASYLLLYSGGANGGSTLDPLESALRSLPGDRFAELARDGPLGAALGYPLATAVTLVGLMPALAGLAWVVRRGRPLAVTEAWLVALLVTSIGAYLVLELPGGSQLYFLWYGFVAGVLAAVGGLMAGWEAWSKAGRPLPPAAAVVGAVALGLLLGLDIDARPLPALYVTIALLLAVLLVAWAAGLLRLGGRLTGTALLAALALAVAGALDGPLDRLPQLARKALDDDRTLHREADPVTEHGLTDALAEGLVWLREYSPTDSVLAVNNHMLAAGDSRFFYYSALSERRVYLESWGYTDKAVEIGLDKVRHGAHPYPARQRLSDAAFAKPTPATRAALRRAGVTHLVVDRVNGPAASAEAAIGTRVYENGAVAIYALG